jgi:hypothetical protein
VVRVRLLDAGVEQLRAVAREEGAVLVGARSALGEQPRDLLHDVELEAVIEEARVRLQREIAEHAGALRVEASDQRGRGVVDLLRPANRKPSAPVRPAPRVEVRVARLPLRVLRALALALDAQGERNPAHAHLITRGQRERGLSGEIGERALVVEIEFDLGVASGVKHGGAALRVWRARSRSRWIHGRLLEAAAGGAARRR